MDLVENIFGGGLLLTLYGWRIIRPYMIYRDVISGAVTSDAINFIIFQGVISAGIALYYFFNIGVRGIADGLIILAFLVMAIVSLYFGAKARRWSKQK